MAVEWRDGGVVFPRGIYGAGDHLSDLIVFSPQQHVPFAINVDTDQDIIVFADTYIGNEFHQNWFSQAVAAAASPTSLQVHYVARAFKLRIRCTVDTDLACEVISHKVK